jgi:hypothetical protein
LGPRPLHLHVYDGDRSSPHQSAWQEAIAEIEAAIILARTDRATARQLPTAFSLRADWPRSSMRADWSLPKGLITLSAS